MISGVNSKKSVNFSGMIFLYVLHCFYQRYWKRKSCRIGMETLNNVQTQVEPANNCKCIWKLSLTHLSNGYWDSYNANIQYRFIVTQYRSDEPSTKSCKGAHMAIDSLTMICSPVIKYLFHILLDAKVLSVCALVQYYDFQKKSAEQHITFFSRVKTVNSRTCH